MKIKINGVVGYDVLPEDIEAQLNSADGDVSVEINSPGGSVFDGVEIFNLLSNYESGKVNVKVTSLAASIASYIMLAGDTLDVYDNSTVMIHNAWGMEMGDHNAMRKYGDHLEALTTMIAESYAAKTGKDIDAVRSDMDSETWLYGDEIQAYGMADSTITTKKLPNKAAALAMAREAIGKCAIKIKERAEAQNTIAEPMKQSENGLAIQTEGEDMATENAKVENTHDVSAEMQAQIETLKKEKAESDRKAEIMNIAMRYNAPKSLIEKFEKEGTPEAFAIAILDAEKEKTPVVTVSEENQIAKRDLAVDALAIRMGIKTPNADRESHKMANMSLTEIVKNVSGRDDMSRDRLAAYAMTSSDFPYILAGVTNKMMQDSFDAAQTTYRSWCQEVDIQDFKTVSEVGKANFTNLSKIPEGGEVKHKETTESREQWALETYAGRIKMTRQMLVNDDLGAFANLVQMMSDAAARTANSLAYSVLTNNAAMGDGVALFHATTHKNYTSSGTAITHDALATARALMRKQSDANGVSLNVAPRYLIVSPDKETEALQLLASANLLGSTDGTPSANTFAGSLEVIVDATLTGNAWYLAAARNTVKVGYLAGTGRLPIIEERDRSAVDGITYDVVYDLGAVATDFRGLYKNAGA